MGTQIQAKTFFPQYCSVRDLNDNAANGMWSLYPEEKTLKNGQYFNSLSTWQAVDGYLENDKEKVRQTILKHESTFRHQLQELHRLYRRQRELMNGSKRTELNRYTMPAETSQSSPLLSHIPSEEAKKIWHVSTFPMVDSTLCRPSTSGTDSIPPLSFTKGKRMPSPFPSQDRVSSKDCQSLKSKHNMFDRRMFDLETPADAYMNSEERQLEEIICGVPGIKVCSLNRNDAIQCDRDVNPSVGFGLKYYHKDNGEALRANLFLKRTRDVADLNEPAKVEETILSAALDNLGNITCLKDDEQRRDVSVNSGFHLLSKELPREGGSSINTLHLKSGSNREEQLTYNFKAGQTRLNNHSLGGVCPDDSPPPFFPMKSHEPSQLSLSARSKIETRRKKMIFGVEISEENHDQAVVASHKPSISPQSGVLNSESSSSSPQRKTSSTLGQNVLSIQENPCISTFDPSGGSSDSLMQCLDFVGGKMHVANNLKPIPSSGAEVPYQNGLSLGSQLDSKQLQSFSSVGADFLSGTNAHNLMPPQFLQHDPTKCFKGPEFVDLKSTEDFKTNVEAPYRFQSAVVPQRNPVSADDQRKHEGGLPWLKAKPNCGAEQTIVKEHFYHFNLDSLKNHSQQFFVTSEIEKGPSRILSQDSTPSSAHDGECRKFEVGDCPISKNIPGCFPLFNMLNAPKDINSPKSPSGSSCLASDVNLDNTRKDLAQDPKSEDQLGEKDFVLEKGLNNYISGLRHHIDLNLSLNEEESPSEPSVPRAILKIATTEIDLEAPAVLQPEMDVSPKADSPENNLLSNVSKDPQEELDRIAAEAIVVISSSIAHTPLDDATSQTLETSPSDCLQWFAEVITSCMDDPESKIMEALLDKDSASDEGSIPDGMDYFEYMTLKLKDTKEEEYCYKPLSFENQKGEERPATSKLKRPRRGQAKRGRQRKDFQRDILPSLVSLSRRDVTKDIQTFEELFSASGCPWQSRLSQRNAAKNGKGRRRSGGQVPSLTATVVCPPTVRHPPICRELALEERSLTGWGKRTRRLPRHRYASGNPTIKC